MQFVAGWSVVQVLGQGAFGEVKLLVNDETQEELAVKVLNTASDRSAQLSVLKEIAIQKLLNHRHVVKYYGRRREGDFDYIFLEYAAGGELFDRIEPDVGMDTPHARRYFLELVSAVEYLHDIGVTHRDIKPENILLCAEDHVKLTDYGLATMFRKNGVERPLDKKCGTMPYVAPEVLLRPYSAPPADVWMCGVTLVAMLAGELPWDKPTTDCPEFTLWRDGNMTLSPWCKLETTVLSLLKMLLSPLSEKRPAAKDIPGFLWCSLKGDKESTEPSVKRFKPGQTLTQPLPVMDPEPPTLPTDLDFSFSQPTILDNLLLSSQLHATQNVCAPVYERLVRRMTRLWVKLTPENAQTRIVEVLEKLGCAVKTGPTQGMTASTMDRRKNPFSFRVVLLAMEGHMLLDFQLAKGDGLEFKKLFLKVKGAMGDVVVKRKEPWAEVKGMKA